MSAEKVSIIYRLKIPSIGRVARDIWRLPLRLDDFAIGHVVVYAITTSDGLVLIDAGPRSDGCLGQLSEALARGPGADLSDVRGLALTHGHPDHSGQALVIQDRTGCWVGMHPLDVEMTQRRHGSRDQVRHETNEWLNLLSVPKHQQAQFLRVAENMRKKGSVVAPDVLLDHGARLPVSGPDIFVEHTPGHTPGHVSFRVGPGKLVFSGDHILQGIYPAAQSTSGWGTDPLRQLVASLEWARDEWSDVVLLPGHGGSVRGATSDAERMIERLSARLREAVDLVACGHDTVWEIARRIDWWTNWELRTPNARRTALASTLAFLERLEFEGRLVLKDAAPLRFEVA